MLSKLLLSAQKQKLHYSYKNVYLLHLVIPLSIQNDRGTETDIMETMHSFLRLIVLELYFGEN